MVRSNISFAISPLRYLVSLPATAGNWLGDWFTSHTELLNENEELARAVLETLRTSRGQAWRTTALMQFFSYTEYRQKPLPQEDASWMWDIFGEVPPGKELTASHKSLLSRLLAPKPQNPKTPKPQNPYSRI